MNNNEPLRAIWTNWGKKQGGPTEWKPLVKDGDPQPGDLIIVERKDGETQEKRVVRALWSDVSKYSGTRETVVDVVDPDTDLSPELLKKAQVEPITWTKPLPNGGKVVCFYYAPVSTPAVESNESTESADSSEPVESTPDPYDDGVPF